jgi:hypothetical protein
VRVREVDVPLEEVVVGVKEGDGVEGVVVEEEGAGFARCGAMSPGVEVLPSSEY